MEKKQNDLNGLNTSKSCGDGGCGCGCGGLVEIEKVYSQEKIQDIRSSGKESPEGIGTPPEQKGFDK